MLRIALLILIHIGGLRVLISYFYQMTLFTESTLSIKLFSSFSISRLKWCVWGNNYINCFLLLLLLKYSKTCIFNVYYYLLLFSSSLMIHDESYRIFTLRRYLTFQLWPVALNMTFVCGSMVYFQVFPLTICVIIFVYNYLLTVRTQRLLSSLIFFLN